VSVSPAPTPAAPPAASGSPLQRRLRRFPGTYTLLGATVLVFLVQEASLQLTGVDRIVEWGAKFGPAIRAGQLWRLITPVFLHAGWLHLLANMYSLNAIGPAVERLFGTARLTAFYLLAGVAGVTLSLAFSPYASVGASGAVFGLLGALGAFLFLHRRTFGPASQVQLRQIVFVALLNLGIGLTPGIDNWGHLGGLLAGVGLTAVLGPRLETVAIEDAGMVLADRRPWRKVRGGVLAAAGVVALLSAAALFSPFGG
jgi:membrane associated rhomboid family serine protease